MPIECEIEGKDDFQVDEMKNQARRMYRGKAEFFINHRHGKSGLIYSCVPMNGKAMNYCRYFCPFGEQASE